ncbi:MAG: class III lanthionine synthetase LanKC [Rhodanobacter sp.]
MKDHPYMMYTLLSKVFYESLSQRKPSDEYLNVVRPLLPAGWHTSNHGVWTEVTPPDAVGLGHGWKIHLSVIPMHAKDMLTFVVPELVRANVSFKFCADLQMLELTLNKNWPRTQVGKFITIYPSSAENFKSVIEALHPLTDKFVGPHILTDNIYKNSMVLHYRYGAHIEDYRLDAYGYRIPGYRLGDGSWVDDIRKPGLFNPLNLDVDLGDKISSSGIENSRSSVLLNGHYRVEKAIKFSGEGGMYYGVDERDGLQVVVREQRRLLGAILGVDGLEPGYTLKKEAAILQKLDGCGFTPRYVDHFEEEGHWFLVQERLNGADTLWGYSMAFYFNSENQTPSQTFESLRTVVRNIATALKAIHSFGVVLRDLTRTNVLITTDNEVRFVDFEFSHDLTIDSHWVAGWTAGYASADQRADRRPSLADDYYAFGALILDLITYSASGFDLNRAGLFRKLDMNLADLGLPAHLADMVRGLTQQDPAERWDIDSAIAHLDGIEPPDDKRPLFPTLSRNLSTYDRKAYSPILAEIDLFFDSSITLTRSDRLWPGSAEIWATNPVNLMYGATGCAYFLLRHRGYVEDAILDWIAARATILNCPPGLFSGLAGVASLLLDSGRVEQAVKMLDGAMNGMTSDLPHGLLTGFAGVGLAYIRFYLATGESRHLERAIELAERILGQAEVDAKGIHWKVGGRTPLGFATGQSGVALFLIYLAVAAKRDDLLRYGTEALDFDLSHRVDRAGQILWQQFAESASNEPHTPHVMAGTAGIGAVALRAWLATGNEDYLRVAQECARSVSERFSNKIWQMEGLSGMGELLIDMAQLAPTPTDDFIRSACYLADGILPYGINRTEQGEFQGTAFGGFDHFRVCSDYGYGTAGIGIFLDRLVNDRQRLFMPDELFNISSRCSR